MDSMTDRQKTDDQGKKLLEGEDGLERSDN
jgi:hypothetical protein